MVESIYKINNSNSIYSQLIEIKIQANLCVLELTSIEKTNLLNNAGILLSKCLQLLILKTNEIQLTNLRKILMHNYSRVSGITTEKNHLSIYYGGFQNNRNEI